MNKKTKRGIILTSLASIAFAGSLLAGSTYALFTSESKTDIVVSSGKVDVKATIDTLKTYSGKANSLTGDPETDKNNIVETTDGNFTNGGTASLVDNKLTLTNVAPGDKVTFNINITNYSNVAAKYRTIVACEDDDGLFAGLKCTIGEASSFSGLTNVSKWTGLEATNNTEGKTVTNLPCTVELPTDAGSEYAGKTCTITYTVEAVQGNAATADKEESVDYELYNVSDLKWFQKHCSDDGVINASFKLMKDIDLNNEAWSPIGRKKAPSSSSNSNVGFSGTFDGNDHTISGLNVTSVEVGVKDSSDLDEGNGFNQFDGYGGLFCLTVNATIKNLTVSGSVSCDSAGGIVGRAKGGTIENCVSNVTVVGDRKAGGIAGMTEISKANGQGNITIKNCTNNGAISINAQAKETSSFAGGIIGHANDVGLVESCVNYGTIGANRCGAKCTGGIVGDVLNNASTIKDCTNYGDVYAGNSYHISQYVEVYGGQILAYQGDPCTLTMTTNAEKGSLSGIAGFVEDRRKTN